MKKHSPVQRREWVVIAPDELDWAVQVRHELVRGCARIARENPNENLEGIGIICWPQNGLHQLLVDPLV
eukprot:12880627-Prorocentrum_lima.AAC.1